MTATVQSVERAFEILDAVAAHPSGVTALAERLALPKSTVARLLGTLEELRAVERVDGPRWRIGPGVSDLAAVATPERSVAALARPHLAGLVRDLGEAAGLALPDGHTIHYVDQVESDNPVQVRDWTGTRAPLHATPSGLVLLAEWPQEAVDEYLARDLERLTAHTVVDPDRVRRRLEQIRGHGVAWGAEEFVEGISSVAAPVHDAGGRAVAAIHVHGPSYRFPPAERRDAIAGLVVAAADAVYA
jgi:DNA-binding IclR family transcriptional regulator